MSDGDRDDVPEMGRNMSGSEQRIAKLDSRPCERGRVAADYIQLSGAILRFTGNPTLVG
jgi:hypothetical protein